MPVGNGDTQEANAPRMERARETARERRDRRVLQLDRRGKEKAGKERARREKERKAWGREDTKGRGHAIRVAKWGIWQWNVGVKRE